MPFLKGLIPWNKGIPRTPAEKLKMRNASLGRVSPMKGISKRIKDCPCGEKTKMSNKKYCSKKCFVQYSTPWNKGKKWSEEVKNKISQRLKTSVKFQETIRSPGYKQKLHLRKGNKNGNWRGGTSVLPYAVDWTDSLRISIRERDKYTCQICSEKQNDRAFHVHHIDYDKTNCDPENLITLCGPCHMKTNSNRNYWKNYFKVSNKNIL